jgi:hypothetical protein
MAESGELEVVEIAEEAVPRCECGGILRTEGKYRDGRARWRCKECRKWVPLSGGPRVPREEVKEEVSVERVEVEGEGVLRALRAVLKNVEANDVGEEEKLARRWLKDDPEKFFREKRLAEREEREELARLGDREAAADRERPRQAVVGSDEAGIRELIRDLLAEMRRPASQE